MSLSHLSQPSKLRWWQWFLFALGIAVLLLPAGLSAAVPALAPLPAPLPAQSAPPLPDREVALPAFQHLLDPLPLVVRDLSDKASQQVVAAYDRATLFQPQTSLNMFTAAQRAVVVPPGLGANWREWLRHLSSDTVDPEPIPEIVLEALRDDPRNGDRLSNLAVALFYTAVVKEQGQLQSGDDLLTDPRIDKATMLLDSVSQTFPGSRGAALNHNFMECILFGPCYPFENTYPRQINRLSKWTASHPDDATALQMLVSMHLGNGEPLPKGSPIPSLLGRLARQADRPRAALGHSLTGDLKLRLARQQQPDAPFAALETAQQALREYDKALALSDDPSIYSARAATLESMGDISAAIATQRRAVELESNSIPLRLRLAELYAEQHGDEQQVLDAARTTRSMAREAFTLALRQRDPHLRDVQLKAPQLSDVQPSAVQVTIQPGEYAAYRPARTYVHLEFHGGQGGFVIAYDLIPKSEGKQFPSVPALPAERAAYDAVMASVILGDPRGATADTARFQGLVDDPRWPDRGWVMETLRKRAVPAAQLASGQPLPADTHTFSVLQFAAETLGSAGLFDRAAVLCRSALESPGDGEERSYQLGCVGENAYLARQYGVARQAFGELGDDLRAGMVAQAAGDRAEAAQRYKEAAEYAAANKNDSVQDGAAEGIATARLGDVSLDSGDAAQAIEHYDRAIRLLAPSPSEARNEASSVRITLQRAYNNRGMARLMLLQAAPDATPDCSGAGGNLCSAALADFEASLRSDPYNPLYLLNKGSAARLLGEDRVAAQALRRAAEVDPTTFPALNDLGVLAAKAGDFTGARQAFADALAANPQYDLALWNLGVLEMQRGVSGVIPGQAYLSRAIRRAPSFALDEPSYRTDDRVYRLEIGVRSEPGAGWTFGRASSFVAAAFGSLALFAAIAQALRIVFTDKAQGFAAEWVERRGGRRLAMQTGEGWRRWLPLIVTLPVLAFVTSWPALRADPATAAAATALVLFATLTAMIAHELGHALVAFKLKARVVPAHWGPGIVLALGLLPLSMSIGPFPGQRVHGEDERSTWWVYLGGPLANVLLALGTYALFLVQPMPGLRLMAQVHLAAISYALLPFEPLDGAALSRSRPMVLGTLAFVLSVTGVLFGLGIL